MFDKYWIFKGFYKQIWVMQKTWHLSLKLNLQVSTTYPRFLPRSSWRGVDWLQQWAGSTFGNSALVWDSKEASPCLLTLSPLCHRRSQLDTATNTVAGLALPCCSDGPGNRNAGTNKACSWPEISRGTAQLIATPTVSSATSTPHTRKQNW